MERLTPARAPRPRLATVWLGGCSGCHMSFLDLDEWLIDLSRIADIVFSPVADVKVFPEGVDVTLVEGAVNNEENLETALRLRRCSKVVVSFGDCAVTGNVTAMRNPLGHPLPMLRAIYEAVGRVPDKAGIVPPLLDKARPLHEVIPVDAFLPGCPPSAPTIRAFLESRLGLLPEPPPPRFG